MNKTHFFGLGIFCGGLAFYTLDSLLASNSFSVEENISEGKTFVDKKKETLIKRDIDIYLTPLQAVTHFPYLRFHADAFSQDDISGLQSLFTHSSENFPLENICHYEQHLYDEVFSFGVCIFLTENLVLTNYHVAGRRDAQYADEFFPLVNYVRTFTGEQSGVETLAVSPLFDLALVRTDRSFLVQDVALGNTVLPFGSLFPGGEYTLLSYSDDEKSINKESYHLEDLSQSDYFSLLDAGFIVPPALIFPRKAFHGESGSPVFHSGKLIGLLSASDENDPQNPQALVTPYV